VSPALTFAVCELPDVRFNPPFACTFHSTAGTAGAAGFASSGLANVNLGSFCATAARATSSAAIASDRGRLRTKGIWGLLVFRSGGKVVHNGMANQHSWSFFRAGGFDQVKLRSGDDLMNIDALDQKLWVALACPTSGLEIDARTLALIDTDKDGRVRAGELIAAVKF